MTRDPSDLIFILDRPSHPGNIGAAARAMKNMGIEHLRLINPREFPHPDADNFASHAVDILATATIFPSLGAAVADCNFLVATTNRTRGQRHTVVTPRELGQRLPTLFARPGTRVGILFGAERTGLETMDVERADWICNIPTTGTFGSLNLAQSVMLIAYEIMMGGGSGQSFHCDPTLEDPRASALDLDRFFQHLHETLLAIDFIKDSRNRHLMGSIKAIFHRAALDQRELAILRGILSEITADRQRRTHPA